MSYWPQLRRMPCDARMRFGTRPGRFTNHHNLARTEGRTAGDHFHSAARIDAKPSPPPLRRLWARRVEFCAGARRIPITPADRSRAAGCMPGPDSAEVLEDDRIRIIGTVAGLAGRTRPYRRDAHRLRAYPARHCPDRPGAMHRRALRNQARAPRAPDQRSACRASMPAGDKAEAR